MKKIFFVIIVVFCAISALSAQGGISPLFNQANEFYSKGQYDKAVKAYEDVLVGGQTSAALYYDLGNAYFKIQRYGKAVLNYEKAARLKPRDPDTRYNLGFARNIVKEPDEAFPEIAVSALNSVISLNELTVLCSVLYFLLVFGIIAYILFKQRGILLFNMVCLMLVVVSSGWFLIKLNREVLSREAIVVSGPADVRNGPGTENSVGFTLPEGRKVVVLGGKDDWAAIGLKTEGLKGWIEKKYLEEI